MKINCTVLIPTLLNDAGLFYLTDKLCQEQIPTVVVDNQPNPKKQALAKNSNLTYLPQNQNQGFAQAVNLATKQAQTPWLLILNDDIKLCKTQTLTQLLTALINDAEKNKLVAISPILKNKQAGVENYGYFVFPHGKIQLNFDPNNKKIDGLTAACLLIKREVFLKTAGFDKRFFAYLEDVDLFLTLKEQGYQFGVASRLCVIHEHLTTSSKLRRGFKQWHDYKNWILLSLKHPHSFCFNLKYFIERARNLWAVVKNY